MIIKQIMTSTEIDRHGQHISEHEIYLMADSVKSSPYAIRMGVGHDPTILPLGKIIDAELVALSEDIIGLEAKIDDFACDFISTSGIDGEALYVGKSENDNRPFINYFSDREDGICISLNPLCFTPEECEVIEKEFANKSDVRLESLAQKSLMPEMQFYIQLGACAISYMVAYKTLVKSTEKLSDKISEDVAKSYDVLKDFVRFIWQNITRSEPKTYIISEPNQPIELVVRSEKASVVMEAIDKISDGTVFALVQKYNGFTNGEIDTIQFFYNNEQEKWELNFLTTKNGTVIGTKKSYKRAIRLYNEALQSPTAGFSIGATATLSEEETTNA